MSCSCFLVNKRTSRVCVFRMGNSTSSTTARSSPACVQYVQVNIWLLPAELSLYLSEIINLFWYIPTWWISHMFLVFDLPGNGDAELCGDIFQEHLSFLQNGQKCLQRDRHKLQSDRTGRAQRWETSAGGPGSHDRRQDGTSLAFFWVWGGTLIKCS